MTKLRKVKLSKDYWPLSGAGKCNTGSEIELPAEEAEKIIEKGIAADAMEARKGAMGNNVSGISDPKLRERFAIDLDGMVKYRADQSEHTKRVYRTDFERFRAWCKKHGEPSLPTTPDVLCRYLVDRAREGKQLATLRRDATAIAFIHELTGKPPIRTRLVSDTLYALRYEYYRARLEYESKIDGITGTAARVKLRSLDDAA